jgi:general stress protein 26
MAYMAAEDCRSIFLVTSRSTKKFQNCLRNPNVSLLIDTREDDAQQNREQVKALTVEGICHVVEETTVEEQLRAAFVKRCPHVRKLIHHPDSAILRVRVQSFLLLDGVIDSYFVKID